MKLPLQITFRGLDESDALAAEIREKAEKLDRFSPDIMSCHVSVELHHKHHERGNLFHVHVDLRVPGKEIVVSREHNLHHGHTDAYVAARDAFDEVRRKLEDYERRRRLQVKTHSGGGVGVIASLHPEEGYGFIESADGRDIYFHRNSLLGIPFGRLEVGQEVRFSEEEGEKGPQASSVHPFRKHQTVG